jgi:hypothetical protein
MKKTKLEILANLLQDKVITIEEFVVLSETTKEYVYYPYYPYYTQPYQYKPLEVWCGTTTGTPISNTTVGLDLRDKIREFIQHKDVPTLS